MPEGNGDPTLCLFPERVTPNLHRLAREFVLLDNFYVDAEVSADGHEWSMAAYATDFVEKIWPLDYGHNRAKKFPYPAEGYFPIATPAGGYLWDRAREAGVSYRSYGEFVTMPAGHQHTRGRTPVGLARPRGRVVSRLRPGLLRPETRLALHRRTAALRGRGRHAAPADRAPAERSHARLVSRLAHPDRLRRPTTTWPWASSSRPSATRSSGRRTAIFVVEDDAQNGPDHVDAHRSTAWVISPYTKRGVGGFHHVFHHQHVADDGADPRPEADVAVRCRRHADVQLLPANARPASLRGRCRPT